MTISEAIARTDALKPNDYTQNEKIQWLSRADWQIKNEIIDTHEGAEDVTFNGYTGTTPTDTELLAGEPYDELYIAWLMAQIDYFNSEYAKYNQNITKFNDTYYAFSKDYNRTHMPKETKIKYF